MRVPSKNLLQSTIIGEYIPDAGPRNHFADASASTARPYAYDPDVSHRSCGRVLDAPAQTVGSIAHADAALSEDNKTLHVMFEHNDVLGITVSDSDEDLFANDNRSASSASRTVTPDVTLTSSPRALETIAESGAPVPLSMSLLQTTSITNEENDSHGESRSEETNAIVDSLKNVVFGNSAEFGDTAFMFQKNFIEELRVSEAALSSAYALLHQSRESLFERVAREVEVYATIVQDISGFDPEISAAAARTAKTTAEFTRIVQSTDDLENMRLLATVPFDTLYDAELLRERVLRRERTFQRVRAEQQHQWYVSNYGDKDGTLMFERAREQRLKADPPKMTAAEMRVRLDVAETQYNYDVSEFSGYIISTITVAMFLIHPNITRQFFTILSCKNVGGEDDPSAKVVLGQMLESCYSSRHVLFIAALGMLMLVLWVLGIPFFAWLVLYRNRDLVTMGALGASTIMRNQKKVFESQMAFLYRGYKPTRYYWFLNDMARKAILVAIAVFSPGALHTQPLLASLLIFVSILLQIAMKPLENKVPEIVELISLFTSFMVFFLANFLFVDTVSESSKMVVTVLISVLVVMFVAVVVVAFFVLQKQEAALVPLRNALREAHAQGMEPEPILREWRAKMALERRRRATGQSENITQELKPGDNKDDSAVDQAASQSHGEVDLFVLTRSAGANETSNFAALRENVRGVPGHLSHQGAHPHVMSAQTDAQRSATIAYAINSGLDITTTLTPDGDDLDTATQQLLQRAQIQVAYAHKHVETRDLELELNTTS